jgi:hypothetical protein
MATVSKGFTSTPYRCSKLIICIHCHLLEGLLRLRKLASLFGWRIVGTGLGLWAELSRNKSELTQRRETRSTYLDASRTMVALEFAILNLLGPLSRPCAEDEARVR